MFDDDDDDDNLAFGAMDDGPDVSDSAIYQKAEEIQTLAIAIVEAAPDDVKSGSEREQFELRMLEGTKDEMMQHAHTITAKLAGAWNLNMYDLQMENAALIRRSCRELVTCLRGLEIAGHLEEAHFDLLREAVKEFQPLFVQWVASFQDSFYLWDDWGLFNPPGAVPDTE
ncbi:MAG: hypothetical protein IPL86_06655 [Flavobacteriales bacterium]|nr:hypothetical protein [Flavobacteriales bacterium]